MQDWLSLHTNPQSNADDAWYLNFAQNLVDKLQDSPLLADFTAEDYKDLALLFAVYLEDSISENGGWCRFRNRMKELYGKPLPFYTVQGDDYLEDEINLADIQFVIWSFMAIPQERIGDDYILFDPFDKQLLELAKQVYNWLDEVFEDAPVTEGMSNDWIMDASVLAQKMTSLPSVNIADCKSDSAKRLLEFTGGYPLMFIDTYDKLLAFLVDVLKWENKKEQLMPEMKYYKNFVVYANAKGILLAPEIAVYFESEKNALFNQTWAEEDSHLLYIEKGSCPYDLLKYGTKHGYLEHAVLPFENGKSILRENMDFITRWYLEEFYEGE